MIGRSPRRSLGAVLAALEHEGLLDTDRARAYRETRADTSVSPWYLRAMVGFGAWLAALLLIGFVVGVSLVAAEGGFLVLGVLLIAAALMLRRRFANDFAGQLTLAMSLAGQGLLAAGILASLSFDSGLEVMLIVLIALNALLIVAFPDDTHRFLSTVGIVAGIAALCHAVEAEALVPLVGPLAIAGAIGLAAGEARLSERGWIVAAGAVRVGLVIGACGCLMLSTLYVLPEVGTDQSFYPRPWISTLLLGALLLWLLRDLTGIVFGDAVPRVAVALAAIVVVASAWLAPGIVAALVIIVLGGVTGSVLQLGIGIVFLAVFMSAYFYGIEVGMLAKSATLIVLGIVVLVCRWLLLRHTPGACHPEAADA